MNPAWPPQFVFAVCQRGAEHALKQQVGRGAHRHSAVGTLEGLVGRHHSVGGAQRRWNTDSREIFGRLPDRQRDAGVDQRGIYVLPSAVSVTALERCQDARQREKRRTQIG